MRKGKTFKNSHIYTRKLCPPRHMRESCRVVVEGPTGCGKSRNYVLANLLQCDSDDYPTSFFVVDHKGEFAAASSALLESKGYTVKVLDLEDPARSNCFYDPLHYINAEADVMLAVKSVMENTECLHDGSEFNNKLEELLLTALISLLIHHKQVRAVPPDFTDLHSMLLYMLNRYPEYRDVWFDFCLIEDMYPRHVAAKAYRALRAYLGVDAKQNFSLIVESCLKRVEFLSVYSLPDELCKDAMQLDKFRDNKVAIFLSSHSCNKATAFLHSLLISQALCSARSQYDGNVQSHFMLDEFVSVGKITALEQLWLHERVFSLPCHRAGFNISLIFQSSEPVKGLYGPELLETFTTKLQFGRVTSKLDPRKTVHVTQSVPDDSTFEDKPYDVTKHPNYKKLTNY